MRNILVLVLKYFKDKFDLKERENNNKDKRRRKQKNQWICTEKGRLKG